MVGAYAGKQRQHLGEQIGTRLGQAVRKEPLEQVLITQLAKQSHEMPPAEKMHASTTPTIGC
jgi:hypothetical protein